MKILTAAEMREVDRRTTDEHGVPSLQLMENAAMQSVRYAQEQFLEKPGRETVVLCGKGNNGGDGLAFARLWRGARGVTPRVLLFAQPEMLKGDAATNYRRWHEAGGEVVSISSEKEWATASAKLAQAGLIVDALLGTGLSGSAEGLLGRVIEDVNRLRAGATVLAVDIPSGLASDGPTTSGPRVCADHTVTFTAPKVGLVLPENQECVGHLEVAFIGSPPELVEKVGGSKWRWVEPGEFRGLPLQRKRNAHKGDFGHALICAGSRGKAGAAGLAGMGSLRSGAGLTTVATPESSLPVVASYAPEYMSELLAETETGSISLRCLEYGRFEKLLEGKSALALGPGLSTHPETLEFVRTVVRECPVPLVLDADGLNAFAGRAEDLKNRASRWLAVTPHPGEMARLASGGTAQGVQQRRLEIAVACAARWNAFVILKGYQTLIATPDGELFINSTGTPAMASGGTGDVLTGVLAGLTAQFGTEDWGRVLALGVWLHGRAGELLTETGAPTLLASELAHTVSIARGRLEAHLRGEHALDFN